MAKYSSKSFYAKFKNLTGTKYSERLSTIDSANFKDCPKASIPMRSFFIKERREILDWCQENFGNFWIHEYQQTGEGFSFVIYFKHDTDRTVFLLKWS